MSGRETFTMYFFVFCILSCVKILPIQNSFDDGGTTRWDLSCVVMRWYRYACVTFYGSLIWYELYQSSPYCLRAPVFSSFLNEPFCHLCMYSSPGLGSLPTFCLPTDFYSAFTILPKQLFLRDLCPREVFILLFVLPCTSDLPWTQHLPYWFTSLLATRLGVPKGQTAFMWNRIHPFCMNEMLYIHSKSSRNNAVANVQHFSSGISLIFN